MLRRHSAIQFRDQTPQPDPNGVFYKVDHPDDLSVRFEYSDGHDSVKKTFKFAQKSYLAAVSSQVTVNGVACSLAPLDVARRSSAIPR